MVETVFGVIENSSEVMKVDFITYLGNRIYC